MEPRSTSGTAIPSFTRRRQRSTPNLQERCWKELELRLQCVDLLIELLINEVDMYRQYPYKGADHGTVWGVARSPHHRGHAQQQARISPSAHYQNATGLIAAAVTPDGNLLLCREEITKIREAIHAIVNSIALLSQTPKSLTLSLELWQTDLGVLNYLQVSVLTSAPKQPTPLWRQITRKLPLVVSFSEEVHVRFWFDIQEPDPETLIYQDTAVPPKWSLSQAQADPLPTQERPKEFVLARNGQSSRLPCTLWSFFMSLNVAQEGEGTIKGRWRFGVVVDGNNLGEVFCQGFKINARSSA